MTSGGESSQTDQILVKDLRFRCIVGTNEDERHEKQDVVAQITLDVDLRRAGRTDDLADTVDYKALKKEILAMAERSQFQLVESLAQRIADICLKRRQVCRVIIAIEKPGALRFARTVGVRIVRSRTDGDE